MDKKEGIINTNDFLWVRIEGDFPFNLINPDPELPKDWIYATTIAENSSRC